MTGVREETLAGLKRAQQAAEKERRRTVAQTARSGGAKAAYVSLPAGKKAEYVRDLQSYYRNSSGSSGTQAQAEEPAAAAESSPAVHVSSGHEFGGHAGSLGEALGYGEAIEGGIQSGLWRGAVTGPLNLGASAIGQKISSPDSDTWLGKTAQQREREIDLAFLAQLRNIWGDYTPGNGELGQNLKDTIFTGYNSAFQNLLEGSGRSPDFPGGEGREALYLGSNVLFHVLKEYALPAITGSHDKEYNAQWLTGKAYEVGDKLTEKVSSVPGLQYVDGGKLQNDLAFSSPSVQLAGKVSQSVANMLPAIALSVATKNPDAARVSMSASAAGNAAKEAYESGATPEQAYYIGLEKGYVEYLTEGMFDALGVFGGGALTPGIKSLLGEYAATKGGRALVKAGGILGENVEEGVSDWAGTGIERAVLGHTLNGEADKTLAEALAGQAPWTEEGLVTLLSTLALNGGSNIVNGIQPSAKATAENLHANVAKYLRRMEELGHLPAESSKNAAHDGAAEGTLAAEAQKHSGLQGHEDSGKIIKRVASGALDFDSKEASAHAERYYESVRHMKSDAQRIAKNTGLSVQDVLAVKHFLFEELHDLEENGIRRFYPDYDIAQSWQRLIEGKRIQPHDLTLLRHELLEQQLMHDGKTQSEAHEAASEVYDYAKELKEYRDKTKKHKKG